MIIRDPNKVAKSLVKIERDKQTNYYNKEINHQNLPTIHPKSVLRLVEDRGKLLVTSDGWFMSYYKIRIRVFAALMDEDANL